jgi:hypothetical protein
MITGGKYVLSTDNLDSSLQRKKELLLNDVETFGSKKTNKLRKVNQGFNIGLTVAGLTCTALTTVLGVIDNPKYDQGWIKFGVAFSGAIAVASQAASREFRLRGKAGEYIKSEVERTILESKIKRANDLDELKLLEDEFDTLQRDVAKIELETNN